MIASHLPASNADDPGKEAALYPHSIRISTDQYLRKVLRYPTLVALSTVRQPPARYLLPVCRRPDSPAGVDDRPDELTRPGVGRGRQFR